jgi:murein DD-endopeptidase MepM/ murein hydrolase activator NlpD
VSARRRVHKTTSIQRNPQDSDQLITTKLSDQTIKPITANNAVLDKGNNSPLIFSTMGIALLAFLYVSFFSTTFAKDDLGQPQIINNFVSNSPLDVPVLSAVINPNPQGFKGGAEITINEGALVSTGPVGRDEMGTTKVQTGEISVYTVRAGDTLSHIAEMYNVTANTILWANDLSKATAIKEGQTLVILPVAGVQHKVKKGDTLNSIAKKYDGDVDEIMTYNQFASNEDLVVGETIVVPGGLIKAAPVKSVGSSKVSGGKNWLAHPAPGAIKTQGIHGYNAIDLASAVGTSIRAAAAGEVMVSKSSGWNGGYGQYIVIKHSNGAQTLYAHLSANNVGVGAYVNQGEIIGAMGNSGRSTGPHLHFEVRGASNPL